MKITKLGHCCLVIEENSTTVLTDPGAWTTAQNDVKGIDVVVITHEHPDHFHLESLKRVLSNNPEAQVVTNSSVSALIEPEGIAVTILEDGHGDEIGGMKLAAFGNEHAVIHPLVPSVTNTGYLFAERLFYPGDAFTHPDVSVEIAAMPIIGPWMKLSEALDWAQELKPQVCIPVHDGMLNPREWIYRYPTKILGDSGIQLDAIEPGEQKEY